MIPHAITLWIISKELLHSNIIVSQYLMRLLNAMAIAQEKEMYLCNLIYSGLRILQ